MPGTSLAHTCPHPQTWPDADPPSLDNQHGGLRTPPADRRPAAPGRQLTANNLRLAPCIPEADRGQSAVDSAETRRAGSAPSRNCGRSGHGRDAFAYPRDVIARISRHSVTRLEELFPDHLNLAHMRRAQWLPALPPISPSGHPLSRSPCHRPGLRRGFTACSAAAATHAARRCGGYRTTPPGSTPRFQPGLRGQRSRLLAEDPRPCVSAFTPSPAPAPPPSAWDRDVRSARPR